MLGYAYQIQPKKKKAATMIRILVADDHAIVREGMKQIVAESYDMVVAGETNNGQEAIKKALSEDYDVVILDISMPDRHGIDVLKEIKNQKPELPILILTIHSEEQYAVRALKAGASGFLNKESIPEELVMAIRKVSLGGKYISQALAEKLASYLVKKDADKPIHQTLSDREYQVMCLIASGETIKTISEKLLLSAKTISTYRLRILSKMEMHNNAELISYVIKNRLLN